nr:hypothetical protein [Tanacetum cinerariifolium]
ACVPGVPGSSDDDIHVEESKEEPEEDPGEDPIDYVADADDDKDEEEESSITTLSIVVSANVVDRSIETDNPRLPFWNSWSLVDHVAHLTFEDDDDEEEEHLAPADYIAIASPVIDLVPSVEETEPFETDESVATPPLPPAYRTTSRMFVRSHAPIPFPSEAEVSRLLALHTPPPSPLTPLSSPLP